jgi:hypothetical protein
LAAKGLPTEYRGGEGISSVVIDPNTPDVIYVSQYYSAEDRHPLYRTKDGGLSRREGGYEMSFFAHPRRDP